MVGVVHDIMVLEPFSRYDHVGPHWNKLYIPMMYPRSNERRLTLEDGDSRMVGLSSESHMDVY